MPMKNLKIDNIQSLAHNDTFVAAFLNALADRVHADNVTAGWWTDITTGQSILHSRNVPEILMLIVSEVAEAMEGHRKNKMDDHLPHRPGLQTELADAFIRILDLAGSRVAIERENATETFTPFNPIGDIFVEKRAYNFARADHKIENRRKDGGKKI